MNELHRQTGRTTRMIEHAKDLAKQGRSVYILVNNASHLRFMQNHYPELRDLGIKFETEETLDGFDWFGLAPRYVMHPNCVVLVDHWAIESRLQLLLSEMHRWDHIPDHFEVPHETD